MAGAAVAITWKDTYATLHMWTQVVGKIALARAAPMNHSWAIAFHFTSRGLRTRLLVAAAFDLQPGRGSGVWIGFDILNHRLVIETSDGERRSLPLAPGSVAEFYREVMTTLDEMGLPVQDLVDAVGDSVAGPIRARHRAPQLRSGVHRTLVANSRARAPGVHGVSMRVHILTTICMLVVKMMAF